MPFPFYLPSLEKLDFAIAPFIGESAKIFADQADQMQKAFSFLDRNVP